MMAQLEQQLRRVLIDYLEERIDLPAVREWLEDHLQALAEANDPALSALEGMVWLLLSEHDRGHRSDPEIRARLATMFLTDIETADPPNPFDLDSPMYELDGRRYVRVSTVLEMLARPGLERWRGRIGNDAADRIAHAAATYGTRVHQALAQVNQALKAGQTPDLDAVHPDLRLHVEAYLEWVRLTGARVIDVERLVVHERLRYAGTCDLLLELEGQLAVADFKTTRTGRTMLRPVYRLQLAAYQGALIAAGEAVARRLAIQLPSDCPAMLRVEEYHRHRADWQAFRACLRLWEWQQRLEPPRISHDITLDHDEVQ